MYSKSINQFAVEAVFKDRELDILIQRLAAEAAQVHAQQHFIKPSLAKPLQTSIRAMKRDGIVEVVTGSLGGSWHYRIIRPYGTIHIQYWAGAETTDERRLAVQVFANRGYAAAVGGECDGCRQLAAVHP